MKDSSLDDIDGRVKDLALGCPRSGNLSHGFRLYLGRGGQGLAAAICRAHNNYVAERCKQAPDKLKGIALVPIQDPPAAVEEMRRAGKDLGRERFIDAACVL